MTDLKTLLKKLKTFRDRRDWEQFHTPKNLAESLVIEASEVLELFQWKNEQEAHDYLRKHKEELGFELADVLNYILLLSDLAGINLVEALNKKIRVNKKKYPVTKSKGSAKKIH